MLSIDKYVDWTDYRDLINSFEYQVCVMIDEADYQGSSWVLLKNSNQFGFLEFSWGSCGGCDAFKAIQNERDAEQLREELHQSIKWDSAKGIDNYLEEMEPKPYLSVEQMEYIQEARIFLKKAVFADKVEEIVHS